MKTNLLKSERESIQKIGNLEIITLIQKPEELIDTSPGDRVIIELTTSEKESRIKGYVFKKAKDRIVILTRTSYGKIIKTVYGSPRKLLGKSQFNIISSNSYHDCNPISWYYKLKMKTTTI